MWLLLPGAATAGPPLSSKAPPLPTPESALEARTRSGAWASPGAAWHHLLIARSAPHDASGTATAIENYQLAVRLDPDLIEGWIGLAARALPTNPGLGSEAIVGAIQAASRSWEVRRRLDAAILPALWLATVLAVSALLLGIGLRHIRPYHHRLREELRRHLGARVSGWVATFICLTPLGILGGIAGAGSVYVGLVHRELSGREKAAVLLALVWFFVTPAAWRDLSERIRPIQTDEPAWMIDRAQREVPTPALGQAVWEAATAHPSPETIFARGMIQRRKGSFEAALADFRSAAAQSSAVSAHAAVDVGNVQLWLGKPAEAARVYERILDSPEARLEARYNLAIALSRLRRFEEAGQRLEEAQKLDLGRVRTASRSGDPRATTDVMDGILPPAELQAVARATEGGPVEPVPPITSIVLPEGRPSAAVLIVVFSIVAGGAAGGLMRRRLAVHSCHRCGAPVCRHCVTRTVGRAICADCARSNRAIPALEYGRLLLHRALDGPQEPGGKMRAIATCLFPGIGLVVRGWTWTGFVLSWLFAFGMVLATRASWAFAPSPAMESVEWILRFAGAVLALFAFALSCSAVKRAIRQRSLRRFFERDAYRMVA